jgi:hypothetical protein
VTRRSLAAAGLVLLALAALATPAGATFTLANFSGTQPALAGNGFVYLERGALVSMTGGPFAKQVFRLPAARGADNFYALDASAQRVGLVHEVDGMGDPGTSSTIAYTAPLPATTATKIGEVTERAISVSGDVAAYGVLGPGRRTIVARDFAAGGAVFQTEAPLTGSAPQVAGSFVAEATAPPGGQGPVVVYDRGTGAEAYRTAPVDASAVSLGDDGTIVVSSGASTLGCATAVAWASPADPSLHAVALGKVCGAARFAGGRIAAVRMLDARRVELVLSDLTGAARRVATQPVVKTFPAAGLFLDDLSPTRLLWGQRRCDHRTVVIQDGLESAVEPAAAPKVACPVNLVGGARLTATRAGKVTVPVRCPRNCTDALVTIRVGGSRVASRLVELVFSRPPDPARIDLTLDRATRARLAARGSLEATVGVSTADVDGRVRRASKRVTIVR